jgi:phosphatidylinositol alpha-1,6-mannosyltransferase
VANLKILMLNNEYPPYGGGTGIVNKEIIEQLAKIPNIQIDLITGNQEKSSITIQFTDKIRIIRLGLNRKNIHHASSWELVKYTIKAFLKARKMHRAEKYDFSFAWSTVPAGFISYLLKLFYKLPYMVRIGGTDIPGYEDRYKTIYKVITPLIKKVWKNSKLLISKCLREKGMVEAINPKLPIQIITNGINLEFFEPKQETENEILTIICPARLIKLKSQDLLIKAIAVLKEKGIVMKLNLVGFGDEIENYKQLAKHLNVLQQVDFKGYVPREKMVGEYHKADIFALPSQNEGMSNALIEGMACGLPVVVSNVGGTDELVIDGENGYVFPVGDLNYLCSVLEKMANNRTALNGMGRKSRRMVEPLKWELITDKYLAVFKEFNS